MLPFTRDQFLAIFAAYNGAVWPAQIVAYALGAALVALVFPRSARSDRLVAAGLALMWLWTGIAYHGVFFAAINTAAYVFAALFVIEAVALAYFGVVRVDLRFAPPAGLPGWLGVLFVTYAAILYPLVGLLTGHAYPHMPIFGITPCPVTLFTFGMLLLTKARVPAWVLIVPFLWSLVGGSAAFALAIPQDWLLLVSGVVVVPLIVLRDRREVAPGGI